MDPALAASVHEANLRLAEGTDAASVGAAVTAELCVDEVHGRIALALRSSEGWSVIADSQRPLVSDEEGLAEGLASTRG